MVTWLICLLGGSIVLTYVLFTDEKDTDNNGTRR
jgi:hypothetical protein